MGKKDIMLKPYLSDDVRFADLVNASVFHGKQIISPDVLSEQDSTRAALLQNHQMRKEIQRTSDVIKKVAFGTNFVIISLENQNDIHYAMPLRNFISEAADYQRQYDIIRKLHEEKKDLHKAEYISGFAKSDRIVPVITIVLYMGIEKWDGAVNLYELMGLQDYPKEIRRALQKFVNNYHINLLDIRHMEDMSIFRSDLKQVFNFIKRDSNKEELYKYLMEHREEYENLSEETFDIIGKLSNFDTNKLRKKSEKTERSYNMCKALEDMVEEAKQEGREEGREAGREEMKAELLEKLCHLHLITPDKRRELELAL